MMRATASFWAAGLADAAAWAFFEAQPPGYRRIATHWVCTANRSETRAKRLATLIAESAAGRRPGAITPPGKKRKA